MKVILQYELVDFKSNQRLCILFSLDMNLYNLISVFKETL